MHLIAVEVRKELEAERTHPVWEKTFGYKVESDLGGLCAEASCRIAARARNAGLAGVRVVDSADGGHTFVRWTQGRHEWIVDVTATQFNNRRPKVCMLRVTSMTRLPHYWREAK